MNSFSLLKLKDVEIDHSIRQELLNVNEKKSSNPFTWRGQFTPEFIANMLDQYSSKDTVVFDPFLGSGTTLLESAKRDMACFGTELNRAAFYMAKVYELSNYSTTERREYINKVEIIIDKFIFETYPANNLIQVCENSNVDLIVKNILSVLIVLLDFKKKEDVTYDDIEIVWGK